MSENTKTFLYAFNAESKKQTTFNDGHRRQLDCLKQIVSDINMVEGFSAEISLSLVRVPALEISTPSGHARSFFIQFGKRSGNQDTLLLTTGLHRAPLGGSKNGYDLTQQAERDECLKQIGKDLVRTQNHRQLAAATISYTNLKP